jgi:hypothetical protein
MHEDTAKQSLQVLRAKKSWGPPTQVQFPNYGPPAKKFPVELPFFQQGLDIGDLHAVPACNPFVAPAKGAHALAKRQMDIQTDSRGIIAFGKGSAYTFFPLHSRKGIHIPIGDGGITGITRARYIVFLDEVTHVVAVSYKTTPGRRGGI